jgi:ABC-2 type transport system permease protein
VLLVGGEYSHGTIRVSLVAVPRRGLFYGAKVLAGTLTAAVFGDSRGLGNVPKVRDVAQALPDQAGAVMTRVVTPDASFLTHRDFGPWTGPAILVAWTVASLAGGHLVLCRRDA